MIQVGIYCRLSIEDKDKLKSDDSQSIQNQKAMLCRYCQERNWNIYDIYCDDGYSGVDRSRPELSRMISDCEKGSINIVLCKDQSRFSRDTVVIEQYINDRFLEWGVRFIGVADNSDSDSEIYGTMRLFTSAYNEMYVRDISLKIRKTLAYKREQGQFIGSFTPYGYINDPADRHHLVIDEKAAETVRMIFKMYVQGNGYRKIVQFLNETSVPSPSAYKKLAGSGYVNKKASDSGGLWTQSTVAAILHNEVYTGTLVQGKSHSISYKNKRKKKIQPQNWIRTVNAHEAIIDTQTWESTQERLHSNNRTGKSQILSPLSGKVRCGICGKPMKRNVYYNKSRTIMYYNLQCADCKTGTMQCINSKTISGLVLEKSVTDELNKIINEYCDKSNIRVCNIQNERLYRLECRLKEQQKHQLTIKSRISQLYKDKLDGILTSDDYVLFRREFSDEVSETSENIAKLENEIKILQSNSGKDIIPENFTGFSELDRITADEFIEHIEIGNVTDENEREITIYWKI